MPKGTVKSKPYSNPKNRPKYEDGQVDRVWEDAKDIDGKVYDPNTGEELLWDKSKSRAGQWDMGHTPENKYSEWHKKYLNDEITKQEFLDWYRNPKNYRPESPSANRSHKYE
ncbi:HNH/ENDO VII family nuclease [Ornithinibacillus contaminans]|uniref:HNH/ENDO VII family nuclease n=1 Tax=Ornithinibacillus contaminans TaxID=694055 RepID=UPI00191C566A|nr:HNH/ENDO VII family nuclease [Ornithinibacillus contaminans]